MSPKGPLKGRQIRRHELTDEEWELLAPLLPACETRGRYYHDHRAILNGMLYWMHMGVPWRDLPERYGPCTAGSDDGPEVGSGTGFSTRCSESLMVSERSSGR